jgi:hypothetical protein
MQSPAQNILKYTDSELQTKLLSGTLNFIQGASSSTSGCGKTMKTEGFRRFAVALCDEQQNNDLKQATTSLLHILSDPLTSSQNIKANYFCHR